MPQINSTGMPAGPSRLRQCESFHYDNPRLLVIRKVSLAAACKPCSAVFSHMQWLRHSQFLFNVGRTSRFQQVPTFLVDVCSRADSVSLFWKPSCCAQCDCTDLPSFGSGHLRTLEKICPTDIAFRFDSPAAEFREAPPLVRIPRC